MALLLVQVVCVVFLQTLLAWMAPTGGRDSVKVNARRARARVSRNDGREEERERRQALLSEKETESVGSFLLLGTERDARRQAVTSERFFLFFFFIFFFRFFFRELRGRRTGI